MDEFTLLGAPHDARRATCAVCHEPVASTDAVVYLAVEKLLMHRACCDAHPSCHC